LKDDDRPQCHKAWLVQQTGFHKAGINRLHLLLQNSVRIFNMDAASDDAVIGFDRQ
jgi:hypothetical protein